MSECSCESCVSACENSPGWFSAEQLPDIQDLVREGLVGTTEFMGAQGVAPAQEPDGSCVFLQEGKCSIHDSKPSECADYLHGDPEDVVIDRKLKLAEGWEEIL